jgi:hypothetical protein
MVRLGSFFQLKTREKLTFREWAKKYKRDGIYKVRILFPPLKYPNFTLVFEDYENREIRLAVKSDLFKKAMLALGIKLSKADLPTLEVVVSNTEYGLQIANEVDYVLEWKGKFWARTKVSIEDKEDLPVEF